MTPIRKIQGKVENGYLSYAPAGGNDYRNYNPSVLAAPIAAQIGGYLTQLNTYDEAFKNLDMKMLMTKQEREAYKFANKYASAETPMVFSPTYIAEQEPALWLRGYSTFEKVNLRNGPKVSNILYGTFGGGESKMYDIGHGFSVQYAGYLGYVGSHQAYSGNDIYQNGAAAGVTAMFYKGGFFGGVTASIGFSIADASTKGGSEDFPMMTGGVAAKTGYNWELAEGKFIIQPSFLMSYSFVDAFDYTNAAGIKIKDDTLNAINMVPGLKFIGNLSNGWQPYMSIQLVWNIMDKTKFQAADVQLPYMSVKPYLQYGLGIQKHYGDRWTGYLQAMLRGGGRNGVAVALGLRYAMEEEPLPPCIENPTPQIEVKSLYGTVKPVSETKVEKEKEKVKPKKKTRQDKAREKAEARARAQAEMEAQIQAEFDAQYQLEHKARDAKLESDIQATQEKIDTQSNPKQEVKVNEVPKEVKYENKMTRPEKKPVVDIKLQQPNMMK